MIPEKLVEEARRRGIDVEEIVLVLRLLAETLGTDPPTLVETRLEIAEKFLEEGRNLIEKDPVQASEKLYKAAEEIVKALAVHFNLENILSRVRERGRWTAVELEKAVLAISKRLGEWFFNAWDHAWNLHVWGFHEAKFDSEDVRERLPYVEKLVRETVKLVRGEQ